VFANVINPNFVVALTGAGSTLLLGPELDIRNIAKVFGPPQMLGGVVELAGAVLF
jgi:hypothetical protein